VKAERWQQVERVYESALAKDASERASFLEDACAGDDALRQEVESLLAYQERSEDFIESPALDVAAKLIAMQKSTTAVSGQMINHYKIVAAIGAGGGAGTVIVQGRDRLDLPRGTELTITSSVPRRQRTSTSSQRILRRRCAPSQKWRRR